MGPRQPGRLHRATERDAGTRVLYVSPLKALAVDVERNLRTPLAGTDPGRRTAGSARRRDISVGVRSGDTPPARRRQLIAQPPDVLITTPGVAVFDADVGRAPDPGRRADRDRRRDARHRRRASAARTWPCRWSGSTSMLAGGPRSASGCRRPCVHPRRSRGSCPAQSPTTIVAPPAAKTFELTVQVPVPDMANLANNTIWPDVEARLVDLIESHNSTIVFANSRRLAERLTARLNEIHAERVGHRTRCRRPTRRLPAAPRRTCMGSGQTYGAPTLLARAHHGSVSKEQRAVVEEDLKRGRLKAVVATSSLELGIDMGAVDLVIQVEAPPSVASGLQRIGRAGHQVGEISQGVLFPKHRTDLIGCAVTVQRMLAGQIETMRVPTNPLDILAQHTVAAAALEPLDADRWFDTVRRSAPFATLPRSVFEATLDLLSGKYPSTEFAELRPRLVYDRDTGTLTARPGRAAAGGHLRRRHPGSRTVHRLPGYRFRKAFAGRRTRRGDGLRVPPR